MAASAREELSAGGWDTGTWDAVLGALPSCPQPPQRCLALLHGPRDAVCRVGLSSFPILHLHPGAPGGLTLRATLALWARWPPRLVSCCVVPRS